MFYRSCHSRLTLCSKARAYDDAKKMLKMLREAKKKKFFFLPTKLPRNILFRARALPEIDDFSDWRVLMKKRREFGRRRDATVITLSLALSRENKTLRCKETENTDLVARVEFTLFLQNTRDSFLYYVHPIPRRRVPTRD